MAFRKKQQNQKITFKNGDYFTGQISDDSSFVKGKYVYKDGSIFQGEFVGWKFKKGTLTRKNGSQTIFIYRGTFLDNRMHGQGQMKLANGGQYIGIFENGQ